MKLLKDLKLRFSTVAELFGFLWSHKLWWIIPIILLIVILLALVFFAGSTGVAPFIYPLF